MVWLRAEMTSHPDRRRKRRVSVGGVYGESLLTSTLTYRGEEEEGQGGSLVETCQADLCVDGFVSMSLSCHADFGHPQIAGRAMPVRESHIKEILRGQREEIQLAPCQRPRYRNYPKCFHCIRKSVGDVCRFRGFRRLP